MSDSSKIRVLIIDDSATIRSALKIMIRREEDMQVIGTAPNGAEGVRMATEDSPDVIIMDIEMPVMDGIQATAEIMRINPVPIVIFSSLAEEAAPKTLEALDAGAVDFVLKDTTSQSALDIGEIKRVLVQKIRAFVKKREGDSRPAVARTIVRNRRRLQAKTGKVVDDEPKTPTPIDTRTMQSQAVDESALTVRPGSLVRKRENTMGFNRKHAIQTTRIMNTKVPRGPVRLIAIGASTGGPQALTTLVQSLPADLQVPVFVVQHMPASFITPFAKRLESAGNLPVQVATHRGEALERGITIAPGGQHMRIYTSGGGFRTELSDADLPSVLHKPSVDVLFDSVCDAVSGAAIGLVLTGMGKDGAAGAKRLHGYGGTILAQDESSSVVYGMPRVVVEAGCADVVLPIEELGEALVKMLRRV